MNFEHCLKEFKDVIQISFTATNSTDQLEQKYKLYCKSEVDIKHSVDQAFREVCLDLLVNESDVSVLQDLVRFCIQACRKGITTPTMPVVLLGDIFDSLTLDMCDSMFYFVENEVNVWKEELFFISCKNNLLRMCNDLLRRLSRSSATIFCGRILLFLAKFFPFSERSGLNIVSEFNLENVTEYGADALESSSTEHETGGTMKSIIIDYSLYCKFWSLQDFFRNPNQCYNKVQWKLFCSHTTSILSIFQGLKLEHIDKGQKNYNESDRMYFSKYLTNQKLLDLQIYDVNFRRSVLLQFLILFQYLTSSVKFKSESFELKTDQKEWVQNITDKIYTLLKETPPDGEKFEQIVRNILSREEHWNLWKNEGCPEFTRSIPPSTEVLEKPNKNVNERPLLGNIIKEASSVGKYYMGSPELTKLWNLYPNNLEACKIKERDFLPSLENYFAEAINQIESNVPIKDEDNLLKDGNFGWRALRLMARRSPHFFTYSNNPINQLPEYLEMMVHKIVSDRPGRLHENTEQNDADLEENLFKAEEETANEDKQGDSEEFPEETSTKPAVENISPYKLELFSEKIAPHWKKLAAKLGYSDTEIKFFGSESDSDVTVTKNMLQFWFEDDVDATLANFLYILEGLGINEAADVVRNELNNAEL